MNRRRIVKILLCISLFASVTNFLPISVSYCLLIFVIPLLSNQFPHRSITFSLLCLYIYFFISVVFYHPQSLINPAFYRRDGNFFITFLPLLILTRQRQWFNTETIVRRFIYFATLVNLACMVLPRVGINPSEIIVIENTTVNHFLFEAHNAAGGFIGVLLSLCVGFFFAQQKRHRRAAIFICCLINSIALLDSGSRGTLIAFLVAMMLFVVMRKGLSGKKRLKSIDKTVFAFVLIADIIVVAIVSDEKAFRFVLETFHITERIENIGDRLSVLWPKALKLFSSSPVFGTGYGSFNDEPIHLSAIIKNVLAYNDPIEYIYDSAHAHNTYLHVMAETGIVGLFLLVMLTNCLRNHVVKIKNQPLRYGLYIGLGVNIFSSFTEHRFFTPAQMIPYVLVLGMIISEERSKKSQTSVF